jgi:hypothetical protein
LEYLESSQETEIKNSSESQVIERIRVRGDLQRKMNVHPTGIEPVTFGFVDRCSIQLSYRCKSFNVMNIGLKYPEVNATGLFVLVKPLNSKRNQN